MATIALIVYVGIWTLVISIITIVFMVDQSPFLFKTLTWVDNNTFPFQQHFKVKCDFLWPLVVYVFLLFEQLIGQQMVWLQDSILECLHYHTLSNILSNGISKSHCAWILSCFSLGASVCLTTWPIISSFWLTSIIFSTTHWIWLGLPHASIANVPWCICTHPIDPMGIHFLHCAHGNKHTWTHDAIAWDAGFHMGWDQLHAFLSNTFNLFYWQVDIVLTKNDICILIDVVSANPTWVNLLPQSCATQGFVAFDATQAKKQSYRNWHLANQFLPLAVEAFGCLHK